VHSRLVYLVIGLDVGWFLSFILVAPLVLDGFVVTTSLPLTVLPFRPLGYNCL